MSRPIPFTPASSTEASSRATTRRPGRYRTWVRSRCGATSDRFDRTAPVLFSPADPRVLFFASQVLWKTSNGGETWETISPDLTREDPGTPPNLGHLADKDTAKHRGVIYSIAPSPKDAATIWVGTDDGLIHVTRDGGKSWKNVTPPEMTPWSKVTQMDASRFDAETVYASVSRFRLDDLKPYIYRTRDGGKTWHKIVTGLPENASVNTVREDPQRKGLLFAGTERQVWVSFDDGDHWQSLRLNMPATSIRDLVDPRGRRRRRDTRPLLLDPGRHHAAAAARRERRAGARPISSARSSPGGSGGT